MRRLLVMLVALVVVAAGCSGSSGDDTTTSTVPETTSTAPEVAVSEVQEELMAPGPGREAVEFVVDAPGAESVMLEMTANFWNSNPSDTIELFPIDDERGSHAVTLHLGTDEWLYRFRVDGIWTVDESNPLRVAAEDGNENSLLVVGETLPTLTERTGVTAGTVEEVAVPAGVLGEEQVVVVYTPPGYADQGEYPLLVLLHGYGQPATGWTEAGDLNHAMDNLIADGEIVPFVVAMPNAGTSTYSDAYVDHIIDEVLPYMVPPNAWRAAAVGVRQRGRSRGPPPPDLRSFQV